MPRFLLALMVCQLTGWALYGDCQVPENSLEIEGVAAGDFRPADWRSNTLNLVPDVRCPLLEPRPGKFRNIYAPSIVEIPEGWRIFYGAWDGVESGNDRIYSTTTADFLTFGGRETIIEHGDFIHICNVHALRHTDGNYEIAATCYPANDNTNKPGYFTSPDGRSWNGSPAPHIASARDLVSIRDYPSGFLKADINGMNVLMREGAELYLYFCDFRSFEGVNRARYSGEKEFVYEGVSLEAPHRAVNDVRKFRVEGASWYVMGLHMNTDRLWYSLSNDGRIFKTPPESLLSSLGDADRYIVAVGFVTRGNCLLGLLYGAGADPGLAQNRIFARWLQKKAVFIDSAGTRHEAIGAYGPDRQRLALPEGEGPFEGTLEIYAEDGWTLLETFPIRAKPGSVIRLNPAIEKSTD